MLAERIARQKPPQDAGDPSDLIVMHHWDDRLKALVPSKSNFYFAHLRSSRSIFNPTSTAALVSKLDPRLGAKRS